MAQVPYLPTPDIWIAMSPTNLQAAYQQALPVTGQNASNSYWLNATAYLREFQTNLTRQHYLSRVEPGTAQFVLNNRDGFFTNGTTNGTGYVIQPRQPVRITASYQVATSTTSNSIGTGTKTFTIQTGLGLDNADYGTFTSGSNYVFGNIVSYNKSTGALVLNVTATSGSGTYSSWNFTATWPIFFGLIDSIEERLTDQLNSDLLVNISDGAKYLSLRELNNASFWTNYAQPINATSTSITSNSIGTGSKIFSVGTGAGFVAGAVVFIGAGTANNFAAGMYATVTSYSGASLTVNVNGTYGSGVYSQWVVYQTSSRNWFQLGGAPPLTVTRASGDGTTTTYTCVNNFYVGQVVSVYGLTTPTTGTTGSPNITNVSVTAVTSTTFSVSNSFNGNTTSTGVAYASIITDNLAISAGVPVGQVAFPSHGALIYSTSNCTDLSAGTNAPSAYVTFGSGSSSSGIDLWVLGQGIGGHTITYNTCTSSALTYTITLNVTASGRANIAVTQGGTTTNYNMANINDGYWHHVGVSVFGGFVYGFADGVFTAPLLSTTGFNSGVWTVGKASSAAKAVLAAYIDEVIIHNPTIVCADILNRYIAGSMLQRGYPVTPNRIQGYTSTTSNTIGTGSKTFTTASNMAVPAGAPITINNGSNSMTGTVTSYTSSTGVLVVNVTSTAGSGTFTSWTINVTISPQYISSGDRIAEILCLAGYGSIVNGAVTLISASGTPDLFFINESTTAWSGYSSNNGYVTVEPYYWDTPVTQQTALDLIAQITDTDIGAFYQELDGTFSFYNQNYYGTWTLNTSAYSQSTWTPTFATPTGDHVWSDDVSSNYWYDTTSMRLVTDDADVWTSVRVAPQSGAEQVYENTGIWYGTTTAVQRFGNATLRKGNTLHSTLVDALSTAYFLGYLFRSPLWRVQNVQLSAKTNNGSNITALLNTEFGDVVNITRTMPNASSSSTAGYPIGTGKISTNMVVESVRHDFQAAQGSWTTSFTLDPYPVRS